MLETNVYQMVDFEPVDRCRLCNAARTEMQPVALRIPDLDTGDDRFAMLRCGECGLVTTDPVPSPDSIHWLYDDAQSTDYELPQVGLVGKLKDAFAERQMRTTLRREPGFSPRRILDYGTGGGRFAASCARIFSEADVVGADFSPTPPAKSYYESDSRIRYCSYEALINEPKFNLIIVRHVLEHLHEPVESVKRWVSMLAPDGVLYLEVPNLESRTARLLDIRWPLLYVPKHLSHFTKQTLTRVVRQAGGSARIGHTEIPMMGNVLALLCGQDRYDPRFRVFGLGLHWFQIAIESLAGQGTCLTAIVRDQGIAPNARAESATCSK